MGRLVSALPVTKETKTMSEYNIEVTRTIEVSIDDDEYTLDQDQAEALLDLLADALGKTVSS